jgi:Uma2 family endonuclease
MLPAHIATRVPPGPPRTLKWTVDQFHYLGDLGVFEGRRAMLIDGVIIEEGPMNPPPAIAGEKTEEAIRAAFGSGWRVRVQKPLVLGQTTDPEPDIAVVRGTPPATRTHPTTADLVVEISDTSLHYDTTTKAEWYAAAGIPDYWTLDANGRRLHVFRDPAPLPPGGHAYRTRLAFDLSDTVSPLAAPAATIKVSDLLP